MRDVLCGGGSLFEVLLAEDALALLALEDGPELCYKLVKIR